MNALRTWLASGALALSVLQVGGLFMAPVSACCAKAATAHPAATDASSDSPECCPPGAHPKGECPLQRSKPAHCRMTCGRASGPEFLLGAIGVLPTPTAVLVPCVESAAPSAVSAIVPFRSSIPDVPPPRLV